MRKGCRVHRGARESLFTVIVDEGEDDEREVRLPTCWAICYECQGEGVRALGGMAITESEWREWDFEDRETYFSGGYDRPCEECGGSGKVRVIDEHSCSSDLLALYYDHVDAYNETEAIYRSERAMGA